MRKFAPATIVCLTVSAMSAHALDSNVVRELNALAPEERLEQRCDMEAMERIASEQKGMKPDKVIAYTFEDPEVSEHAIKASGAVFRSGRDWYRLKYKCLTGSQSLTVQSFDYHVGEKVPEELWRKYNLYE
jgi:hypothetical protein